MAKTWTEWWVEYEFADSPYGKRANMIRTFKNKEDAENFCVTTADGKLSELKCTTYYDETDIERI